MSRIGLAALAGASLAFATSAYAQQQVDWDKVQIKTTDLGHNTYMLEGQGGNITIAVGTDGIIMVDTQFAPLSRQDQGRDQGNLAAADQVHHQHPFPRRPHRRQRQLPEGRRHRHLPGQHPPSPRRRRQQERHHRSGPDRPHLLAASRRRRTAAAPRRSKSAAARRRSITSTTPTPTATPGCSSPTPTCSPPAT